MNIDLRPPTATDNPYVGPRGFGRKEPLYGRDRETNDLVDLLIAERVVVLHSPSGAGKTSLINSRVISLLEEDGFEVLPVVRLNPDLPPELLTGPAPPNRYVLGTMLAIEDGLPPEHQKPRERVTAMFLAQYLDTWPDLDGIPGNEVLIFDQFEEIITNDPTDLEAKKEFFAQLGMALRDRSLWALFSMREDFLAELDPFTSVVPTRLATRYRLDLLTRDAALEAITRPADSRGVRFAPDAATTLADDLRSVRVQRPQGVVNELGLFIEPVQLQVVCRGVWNRLAGNVDVISSADLDAIGDVDQALASFYATCVAAVAGADGVTERGIRDWIERELVTPQGFRGQTSTGPSGETAADEPILSSLTTAHLLRAESRRGTTWYELAHDRLIDPVQTDNTRWRKQNLSDMEQRAQWWNDHGRAANFLLTGAELDDAERTSGAALDQLPEHEREFLVASRQQRERVERERERVERERERVEREREQAAREREQAARDREQAARERRLGRLIRRLLYVSVAVSLVALLALGWALWSANALKSQRALAVSQLWSGEADRRVDAQPEMAILAGLQALSGGTSGNPPTGLVTALARVSHTSHQLTGHTETVAAVAFSPDGAVLATASADKTVRLWDTATGRPQGAPLVGHTGGIAGVDFSPDGRLLATAGADKTVRLWDTATGQPHGVALTGHGNAVAGVAFSPDGTLLASAGTDQTLRLWEVATGQPRGFALTGHGGPLTAVAFSPNGALLATASADRTVRLWDTATGQPRGEPLRGHDNAVTGVAFSPDGRLLASAGTDEQVLLWDVATGQVQGAPLASGAGYVYGVTFSPDGALLASAHADQTIRLWDVATGEPHGQQIGGHGGVVTGVAFSPDGRLLASASADQTARLWDTADTHTLSQPLTGNGDLVSGVAFSPDGRLLASAGNDQTVRLWDTGRRQPRGPPLTGHTGAVNSVVFSQDGALLASAGADQTVRLWDTATGRAQGPPLTGHSDAVNAVAFSPDGRLLASAGADQTVRLWDTATGQPRGLPLTGHGDNVTGVAFSPDGRLLASAGADRTVRLWDTATGQLQGEPLDGHASYVNGVAFSPDGELLASASADQTVRLWDTATGQLHRELRGHTGPVFGVAFNEDGRLLASAGADQTVRLWDTATGRPHGPVLTGHTGAVLGVAFGPDGRQLASAGADRFVRLWDSTFTDWVGAGCTLVNRNLSQAEWDEIAADLPYERTCPDLPSGRDAPPDAPPAEYSS